MLFQKMLTDEIQHRKENRYACIPDLTVPPFHFSVKINQEGIPKLDREQLALVLPDISEGTLHGLITQATCVIKKKIIPNHDVQMLSSLSVFSYDETRDNKEHSLFESRLSNSN